MKIVQRFLDWFRKQKLAGKIVILLVALFVFCCLCSVPIALLNPTPQTADKESTPVADVESNSKNEDEDKSANTEPTKTSEKPINTPEPTNTAEPTDTPEPTNTPLPPTATPDPNLLKAGTYLVGKDIRPGIYIGETAGTGFFESCYWARMKDLSGSVDAILANNNSEGQYYVEVVEGDNAFETACDLTYLEKLPEPTSEFPQKLAPGMYLVGIDIQPGTYKGQGGTDIMESCYWARLSNVKGSMDGLLANDNATGQFYVQVASSDFAFSTDCELERVQE